MPPPLWFIPCNNTPNAILLELASRVSHELFLYAMPCCFGNNSDVIIFPGAPWALYQTLRSVATDSKFYIPASCSSQLDERLSRMKANKADEDALRETRDELVTRLRTLEDVTAARQKVRQDISNTP